MAVDVPRCPVTTRSDPITCVFTAFVRTVSKPGVRLRRRTRLTRPELARSPDEERPALAHMEATVARRGAADDDRARPVSRRSSLAETRHKAIENARAIGEGVDPRGGGVPTFREAAAGKKIIISTVQKFPFIPWTRSEASNADGASRSSLTRPTRARAVAPARPCRRCSPRLAKKSRKRPSRIGSTA